MQLKLFLVFAFVALAATRSVIAAPARFSHNNNEEQIEKSLAEYLRHDAELIKELKQLGFDEHRVKRESEIDIDVNGAQEGGEEDNKPGFFDKAAKFVVELLQRFLRWINTEDS